MRYEIFIAGTEPKEYSPRVKTYWITLKMFSSVSPQKDDNVKPPVKPEVDSGIQPGSDESMVSRNSQGKGYH